MKVENEKVVVEIEVDITSINVVEVDVVVVNMVEELIDDHIYFSMYHL